MKDDNKKEKESQAGIDTFLTDKDAAEDGVEYINPDIELKLSDNKRNECREVVKEIKSFGIKSQREILYLIYLLSLEVENIETMRNLVSACKTGRKDLKEGKKLIILK